MGNAAHAINSGPNKAEAAQNTNPYVFLVGCPRSGTTLLQRMVNAHPKIAITPESHWIPRLIEKPWAANADGTITRKLIRRMITHPKFERLQVSRDQVYQLAPKGKPVTYAWLVTRVLDLYGHAQGKALVGDKTPEYVREIARLHALWPRARFVHLIRDGRDVAMSMLEWQKVDPKPGHFATWKDDPVSTAAWWWRHNVQLGRAAGKALGPKLYCELRYEALVTEPREQSEALFRFLDLPFDPSVLDFHAEGARTDPGLEKKRAGLPVTAGLRDWRAAMPADDVERVEAVAGDLLDELAYPRAVPRPGDEALAHAASVHNVLSRDPLVLD